jgi:hypothetical protein
MQLRKGTKEKGESCANVEHLLILSDFQALFIISIFSDVFPKYCSSS